MNNTSLSSPAVPVNLSAIFDAQREAFLRSGAPTLTQRLEDLRRLRHAIKHEAENIARIISADFGNRSRHETLIAELSTVLAALRYTMRHLRGWINPKRVPVNLELFPARARILYQPLGVVGIISPWNFPFQLAMMPMIGALAAGNRVILKPSEWAPRTADFMADLLSRLFPVTQVATVIGGADTGAAFARLPFNHLFYTGSTAVGHEVMRAAAENLTSVTLELGGKSPCIVGEDADLAAAVESIMYGKLLNAGQACVAPDYVFVPEARREEFAQLAGEAARRLYPHVSGNPDYTTIINDHHYRRIIACLREARAAGTRVVELVAEEAMPGSHDRRITPTLVVCPGDDLAIMRDEIFGPVLVLKTYTRLDEAIDYINRRPRPLALYYFGAKTTLRDRVLGRTVSGGVTVNDTVLHAGVEALPFGGVGLSGIGAYHGKAGFETFSHGKSVFLQARPSVARLLRPPFGRLTDLILRLLIR